MARVKIGTIQHNEPTSGRITLFWSEGDQCIQDDAGDVLETGIPTLREAVRRAQSAWSGEWALELARSLHYGRKQS